MIDLDRIGMILTSNRINNPIDDWITDNRVNTLKNDPNAFVYSSKPFTLKSGATGIKIHLEGHINLTIDLIAEGSVSLRSVTYFCLDEADRMLDMGFIRDIRKNNIY